ncbi:hypothetical protein V8C34DRAFT_141521 [Trichoderma compactum]
MIDARLLCLISLSHFIFISFCFIQGTELILISSEHCLAACTLFALPCIWCRKPPSSWGLAASPASTKMGIFFIRAVWDYNWAQ